ncbi:hypothetical protein [Peloplasma aerotolerans]|uniref:Uncharacterized protein n=1 Tax=Peloplasma aerotolerans TaxID=3044389 RepID=A0AAW6U8X6_9MOLU|nr:hypothetical protein [Mariniplasma sp. M4Ah]MDI6453170.1 hypothetical protein [Mariniplasma sp. M4Ah]MDR4968002.1 hypothetical protein [Acholeplasmataceae bacterium]
MDAYSLPWAFYMKYNNRLKEMTLYLSKGFKEKTELSLSQMTLNKSDIEEFIHRYDYRKLSYFSGIQLNGTFDTILRFKMSHGKSYLKTYAVCQTDQTGFRCIHIEEKYIFKIHKNVRSSELFASRLNIDIEDFESISEFESTQNLMKIKGHLHNIILRMSN